MFESAPVAAYARMPQHNSTLHVIKFADSANWSVHMFVLDEDMKLSEDTGEFSKASELLFVVCCLATLLVAHCNCPRKGCLW